MSLGMSDSHENDLNGHSTKQQAARAAYIHVPFCAHRCGYCDFTLVARRDDLIDRYLAALDSQLQALGSPVEIDTLFFGGGTPTHLPTEKLERLMALTRTAFRLADSAEFSIEANPVGLSREKLDVLEAAGVTRVSLGVQSFQPAELRVLERDHSAEDVEEVVGRLKERWDNVSLDLIFAVPGQTLAQWIENLDRAIALRPAHISAYGLTFERGTAFWSKLSKGMLPQADQELELRMYEESMDRLPAAGFAQYEISNYSRPGRECRHNQVYWNADSFYGFGPGAASFLGGVRRLNHRSVTTWLARIVAGQDPIAEVEPLSAEERAREAVMVGLRLVRGIDITEFARRFGYGLLDLGGDAATRFLDRGWLEIVEGRLRLTRSGRSFADSVIMEFL